MSWNEETIAKLTRLVTEGHTSVEVERLMPGFSRNSIISKVKRLPVNWQKPQVGGRHGPLDFPPEQRAQIMQMLRNRIAPARIADDLHVSYERVLRLMEEEKIARPVKRTSRGRVAPKPQLPPQPRRPAVVVADERQAMFRIVEGPPVRAPSNVVTLPVSGVRTCQWIDGEVGFGRMPDFCGERVAWLGCSWCSVHVRTVFARHPMIGDAAD